MSRVTASLPISDNAATTRRRRVDTRPRRNTSNKVKPTDAVVAEGYREMDEDTADFVKLCELTDAEGWPEWDDANQDGAS